MLKDNSLLLLLIISISFSYFSTNYCDESLHSRQKRFLLWTKWTHKIQVITGIGLPVDLEKETAIVGLVYKANYQTPSNVSDLTPGATIYARKKRGLSRWDIYSLLSETIEMRGLPGKSCILRAICEVADTPLDRSNGLFDEILHTVFTPTTTKEDLNHHTDNEYFAAQKLGSKKEGMCHRHFPDCKISLLDMVTELDNHL